jgi:hypothetical protein
MTNTNAPQTLQNNGQSTSKTTFYGFARLALALALMLFSVSICSASAANLYVGQNASGSANGADCADTLAVSWLNTTSNWGSGSNQVGPGTTVHLCGTITGAAGAQGILISGSGSSGNPITIKFEAGAIMTSPYWGANGAITATGKSFITIDGGTNGIIQNTDNGTLGAFNNEQGSHPIYILGPASNVVIKNLNISNICQHTSALDVTGCNTGGNSDSAIWVQGGMTNLTVTNNTIHDSTSGVTYLTSTGDTGAVISNNTISRTNWAVSVGAIGSSNGLLITGNDISCVVGGPCNWNDAANNFHHNGIMIFPQAAGDQVSGLVVSNNFIHDINTCTAGIFFDPMAGDLPNAKIFNNVFYTTPGQVGPSNAWITMGQDISHFVTNPMIVNNTIIGPSGTGIIAQMGVTIKNNVVSSVFFGALLYTGYSGVTSDFNDWFNLQPGDAMAADPVFFATLAEWTAATGFDTHSMVSNPSLTSSFMPNAGSPLIGKGTNLTSLNIPGLNVGAPQTFGAGGSCGAGCVQRPATGAWTIGAYQQSSTSSPVGPPSGLGAVAH